MRARYWALASLLVVACSVDLAPLDTGHTGSSGGKHSGGATGSTTGGGSGGIGGTGGGVGGSAGSLAGGSGGTPAGGTGAGGVTGGSGGAAGSGAGGATGGVGGTGATGGTPVGQCANLATINTNGAAPCDNTNQAVCYCYFCNGECTDPLNFNYPVSDCICPECKQDPDCVGPGAMCNGDGLCDPFNETCACADCTWHPMCQ